jgi:hypothetical protein
MVAFIIHKIFIVKIILFMLYHFSVVYNLEKVLNAFLILGHNVSRFIVRDLIYLIIRIHFKSTLTKRLLIERPCTERPLLLPLCDVIRSRSFGP